MSFACVLRAMPEETHGNNIQRSRNRRSQENAGGRDRERQRHRTRIRVPAIRYHCERTPGIIGMVEGTRGAGDRHGIDGAILETSVVGSGGAVSAALGTSAVEPWTARPQD